MRIRVALLSLFATAIFFYEFLPPNKWVHLWADFDGYHYPLFNYAHKAIRDGRFPEWDDSIYSGMPFAGNIQAGLFYPPNWALFYLNRRHSGIRVKTMEWLEFLHIWLAFFLAWMWLKGRVKGELPAVFGAAVFAFAGYPVAEMQHYGVICGYAWYPLAFFGLDRFRTSGDWRRAWPTAAASAMCLLAGYPGNWFALAFGAAAYGLGVAGWRGLMTAFGAVGFSALLAAVQLGPSLEAVSFKLTDLAYYTITERDPWLYLQYLLPNFYENSVTIQTAPPPLEEYLYLGSPALAGILWLLGARAWRAALPAAVLMAATFLMLLNPFDLMSELVLKLPVVREVCRGWNFLALLSVTAALLTALGLDRWPVARARPWAYRLGMLLMLGWAAREILFRKQEWLANGWLSAVEAVTCLIVFAAGYSLARTSRAAAAALLVCVFTEYFVYGSTRRFNAKPGVSDKIFLKDARTGGPEMVGVDNAVFDEMRRHPQYRLVILFGPHPTEMRHYGFTTPQGFDPFLTRQYREAVEKFVPFFSNREFRPTPADVAFFDRFAVRFFITHNPSPEQQAFQADPRFRLLQPSESFYNIFEYREATPAYSFDGGSVQAMNWTPEHRGFQVRASKPGQFVLKEQYFAGWEAYLDGQPAPIARALDTFQAIAVPAGEHRIDFRYRSKGLRIGALISLAAFLALIRIARSSAASRGKRHLPEPLPAVEPVG